MSKEEEFVPVPEPKKTKTRKPKKAAAKPRKKAVPKKPANGTELRLSQLEQVELTLTERDVELQMSNIELAKAKINNLTMDYHRKLEALKQQLKDAQMKYEQLALIRNKKLSEIENRLRGINSDFSFKDYLQQDDGSLVRMDEKIASLDPTAESGDSGDTVTA